MPTALALSLLLAALPASAVEEDPEDRVLATGSELREWCQRESEAHLVGQGKTPVNWTARHYEKANTLIVEGHWRVDGEALDVECRAARGARARFASMKLMPR